MSSIRSIASAILIAMVWLQGCVPKHTVPFDIQGHRGCRGTYPENTIAGFIKALDMGVTTLEMDVVITRDKQVLVSHEPFISHEICIDAEGDPIDPETEHTFNIYEMTYLEVQRFDCGSLYVDSFPDQEKASETKPLLIDVIRAVEHYIQTNELQPVDYNIETKCQPATDGIYHPPPEAFINLVMDVVQTEAIADRVIIQSFDFRTLQEVHDRFPDIRTAMLIGRKGAEDAFVDQLGFKPVIYSPHYQLITTNTLRYCRDHDIRLIPWTVNDSAAIKHLIGMGVDGLISDYPERVIAALGNS